MPPKTRLRSNKPARIRDTSTPSDSPAKEVAHVINTPADAMWRIRAIPQRVFELILLSGTSNEEKKLRRLTCKYFCQIVDANISCIALVMFQAEGHQCAERLLRRVQRLHASGSGSVFRTAHLTQACKSLDVSSLFQFLPDYLTQLSLDCSSLYIDIDLTSLGRLPCLQLLRMSYMHGGITGMECLHELTRLHFCSQNRSVASLGPQLKHLDILSYDQVHGLEKLTNLEVLDVSSHMPADFFETHKLPLRHLRINPLYCRDFYCNPKAWRLAPRSLTRLTLEHTGFPFPDRLPASITSLQLRGLNCSTIEAVAAALPTLTSLDFCTEFVSYNYQRGCLKDLSKLTNLKSIGICLEGKAVSREQPLSELPILATAVEKGVYINILPSYSAFIGALRLSIPLKTAWVSPA